MPNRTHRPTRSASRTALCVILGSLSLVLAACGGGGGGGGHDAAHDPVQQARTLKQFGYPAGSGQYIYGYESLPTIAIRNAPGDADMTRWGMTHDGDRYWLFVFRQGSANTLYPFLYDGSGYVYTGTSQQITGTPSDADMSSFAVLYSNGSFALYVRRHGNPTVLYQFRAASVLAPFAYGALGAISNLSTTGAPADADFSRWTMYHDGSIYRQAVFQKGSEDTLYQFGWNGSSYAFSHASRDIVRIVNAPAASFKRKAKILHDGALFRLYQLAP